MDFGGLGLNSAGPRTPPDAATAHVAEKEMSLKGSAGWFLWVGGLSLINSALHLAGVRFQFVFGLGIAQFVDLASRRSGGPSIALDVIVNGFLVAVFAAIFSFARKGQRWAFIAGIALYAVDALLLGVIGMYLAVAFHFFAIIWMSVGLHAISSLEDLEANIVAPPAPQPPPQQIGMFPTTNERYLYVIYPRQKMRAAGLV